MLVLVAGLLLAGPAWQQLDMDSRISTAGAWAGEKWIGLERDFDEFIDQLFIRHYDRRAPAQARGSPPSGAGCVSHG